jgi:predicted DNA-binding transcriptional regulator AlpA|tara:strand:+ start:1029 stop:1247 length:219 start_codon:yes stop_codon:yes gene_type:complete
MMMSRFNFEEDQLLKLSDIKDKLNVSYSTLYRWIDDGSFPKPLVFGKGEKNATTRWVRKEVEEWFNNRPREK